MSRVAMQSWPGSSRGAAAAAPQPLRRAALGPSNQVLQAKSRAGAAAAQSAPAPAAGGKAAGPCLGPDECKTVKTPLQLLEDAAKTNQAAREKRKKDCAGSPPGPACTADGHARRAVETERLLNAYDPSRLALTNGAFVNMDMPAAFKALTVACDDFTPPLASSGRCVTVPGPVEEQAKTFNSTTGPLQIDGMERGLWRERTLEVLVHETEHARFRAEMEPKTTLRSGGVPTLLGQRRAGCSTNENDQLNAFLALNELSAMLQEQPMRVAQARDTVGLTDVERKAQVDAWRDRRITGTRQAIPVALKVVRCVCACDAADALIRQTIEFATSTWTVTERQELDREMNDARWKAVDIRWPFSAPAATPQGGQTPPAAPGKTP
jgi:hypothetical protein